MPGRLYIISGDHTLEISERKVGPEGPRQNFAQILHNARAVSSNSLHNISAIGFCLLDILAFYQLFASAAQESSSCRGVMVSSRKMKAFLHFHSCQQQRETNMLCCRVGTALILRKEWMSRVEIPVWGNWTPMLFQNCDALSQKNSRCSGVSPIASQETGRAVHHMLLEQNCPHTEFCLLPPTT